MDFILFTVKKIVSAFFYPPPIGWNTVAHRRDRVDKEAAKQKGLALVRRFGDLAAGDVISFGLLHDCEAPGKYGWTLC